MMNRGNVAVHRRTLLLPWLAMAVMASWALGDDVPGPPASNARTGSVLAAHAPRSGAMRSGHPTSSRVMYDPAVAPAAYVAQHPIPDEPLGFSQSRFQPSTSYFDPATTYGLFEGPDVAEFGGMDEGIDFDGPAPTVSSGEWLRNGHWYAEASVVYLDRMANVKNDVHLSFEAISATNLNANTLGVELNMGFQPGLITTLGRYLGRDARNRDHSVEFTFFGLTHWQFAKSITAQEPGTIIVAVDPLANPPVFNFSDSQSLNQTSNFNSYEFNYRIDRRLSRDRMVYSRDNTWVRQATPSLLCSALAGIRTVIVNEGINWQATNTLGNGSYLVTTHNNMVGPQVGGDFFYEHVYSRAGVRARTGALVNWASQSSTVRILDTNGQPLSPNRDELVKSHDLAFVGGLDFTGEYRIRPNFGLRFSYNLMWVTNLRWPKTNSRSFPATRRRSPIRTCSSTKAPRSAWSGIARPRRVLAAAGRTTGHNAERQRETPMLPGSNIRLQSGQRDLRKSVFLRGSQFAAPYAADRQTGLRL